MCQNISEIGQFPKVPSNEKRGYGFLFIVDRGNHIRRNVDYLIELYPLVRII